MSAGTSPQRQRVTFKRTTKAISGATGREIVIEAGTWADVEPGGGPITARHGWYRLYIEGRDRHGYEPYIRVHRLHQATEHAEPLFRLCDECHGSGRTQHLKVRGSGRRVFLSTPVACPACEGKGHSKEYAPNVANSRLCA
ncbi:hypothetical protein ABZW49_10580 [Nonomuraea wenchangensis]